MQSLLAEVARYSVPESCDVMTLYHTMSPAIRMFGGEGRVVGTAFTIAGVIIDGAFRDIDGCTAVGVPVFARGVTPGTALKTGSGRWGTAVAWGYLNIKERILSWTIQ